MLAPAPVVGVVINLNPAASFSGEYEACTVRCAGSFLSWLLVPSLPGKEIKLQMFVKFLGYSYQYTIQFLIKFFEFYLQLTAHPYAWKNPLQVWIGNQTYG